MRPVPADQSPLFAVEDDFEEVLVMMMLEKDWGFPGRLIEKQACFVCSLTKLRLACLQCYDDSDLLSTFDFGKMIALVKKNIVRWPLILCRLTVWLDRRVLCQRSEIQKTRRGY